MEPDRPVVCIVGPTASGKSDLALNLAERQNGEIVCADSQTIYRGLDILTAKPSEVDRRTVPHWCLDIADRTRHYTVADFVKDAGKAVADIHSREKLPVIVGGSGLYITALLYGFTFRKSDPVKRRHLDALTLQELQLLAPSGLSQASLSNKRHLVRVIESAELPETQRRWALNPNIVLVGLQLSLNELDTRIIDRLKHMEGQGVLTEVASYRGVDPPESTGFKLYRDYVMGKLEHQELLEMLAIETRQLAKKQRTWFRRDPNIVWFSNPTECLQGIENALASLSDQQEYTRAKI